MTTTREHLERRLDRARKELAIWQDVVAADSAVMHAIPDGDEHRVARQRAWDEFASGERLRAGAAADVAAFEAAIAALPTEVVT